MKLLGSRKLMYYVSDKLRDANEREVKLRKTCKQMKSNKELDNNEKENIKQKYELAKKECEIYQDIYNKLTIYGIMS